MSSSGDDKTPATTEAALEQAAEGSHGIFREFLDYLRVNKKWWLAPIIAVLLLVAGLIVLGGSAAAPFIYTLF